MSNNSRHQQFARDIPCVSRQPSRNKDPELPRARYLTESSQLSCFRDTELHHPDTCSLTMVTEDISPLAGPKSQQKRGRYKQQ